jgi:ferredoxin
MRVAVSLTLMLLIAFILLDFSGLLNTGTINALLYLQFFPSLLKSVETGLLAAGGFLVVLAATLLWGRLYCSTICPLGALQDILARIAKPFRRRKKYRFSRPLNFLRYAILIAIVLSFFTGVHLLLLLLEPYSNFGRIVSDLLRPLYYGVNNILAGILQKWGVYSVYVVPLKHISMLSFFYALSVLGVLIGMTWRKGRLFCNTICPVGALLGLVAKASMFKIRIDEASCESCGLCSADCKAGCIDVKNKTVDMSRCVGCFNCLPACPQEGIRYRLRSPKKKQDNGVSLPRRRIVTGVLTAAGALLLLHKIHGQGSEKGKRPVERKRHAAPPGSLNADHYNSHCTACHLCVSACPTQVLQPALLEYGLTGVMQPFMNYRAHFCNYECNRCTLVCPTGAVLPLSVEEKKLTQIGKAVFIKQNCVVFTDETACGACSEHCPTKAVDMIPYKGSLKIPEVTQSICVGCGACEYACPTHPKSIYVEGHYIQCKAEKPKVKKEEHEKKAEEDFPF